MVLKALRESCLITVGISVLTIVSQLGWAEISTTGDVFPADPGSWTTSTYAYVGRFGNGTMDITSGSDVLDRYGYIGYYTGTTGEVTVTGNGSTWTHTNYLYVGDDGDGTLNINDHGSVSNTKGFIGHDSDSIGVVKVDGDGSTWTNSTNLHVGSYGSGTLNIKNGGDVNNGYYTFIGHNSGSTGEVTVEGTGSTWTNSTNLYVGVSGSGTLSITDGGEGSDDNGYIGDNSGATGVVTVDGTSSLWTNRDDLYVGNEGDGTLEITGGAKVRDDNGYIGYFFGPTSEVTVTDLNSTWTNYVNLYVGQHGSGMLSIMSGGKVSNNYGHIGNESSSTGVVTVDGTGSTWTNREGLYVGNEGNGTLNITNGGMVSSTFSAIGYESGSTGEVTVDGAGSVWTSGDRINIGDEGNGTLEITGGGEVSNNNYSYIGYKSGSTGEVSVEGTDSTWTIIDDKLYVGYIGSGTLNIRSGGAVTVGRDIWVSRYSGTGTIDFDDGTLRAGGLLCASNGLSGTGTIYTGGLVSDVDLVFDAMHGPNQVLTINDDPGQNITINLSVNGSGYMGAGFCGDGTMIIHDGQVIESTYGYIGYKPGATGVVTVDGPGSKWINNIHLYAGYYGGGTLNITGGGLVIVSGSLTTDYNVNGDGFVNMSSGGRLALWGDADESLAEFLGLINGTDAIRYWDDSISDWSDITGAAYGINYTLGYQTEGDLAGYTVLTVHVPGSGDIDQDDDVDMEDFAGFGMAWLAVGCSEPNWCGRADIDHSGDVGVSDLEVMAEEWTNRTGF